MVRLQLIREMMTAKACRGVLEALDADGRLRCRLFTIERPWIPDSDGGLAGENSRSCIAEGTYAVDPFVRRNGDHVWIVSNAALDVFKTEDDIPESRLDKGRCLILIHAANRASELEGCIAPGRTWTIDDGEPIVTNSRLAMGDLHEILVGQSGVELVISRPPATHGFAAIGAVDNHLLSEPRPRTGTAKAKGKKTTSARRKK